MATPAEQLPHTEAAPALSIEDAMKHVRLIGITGKANTGKDTIANYLVDKFQARKMPLAGPIKAILNSIFGFPSGAWNDRHWKETPLPMIGHSPRVLAQSLGTEWGRSINEDLWVSKMITRWRADGCKLTAVPDVRFDNEAVMILRSGGMIVRVERDDVEPVAQHASEAGIQDQLIHISLRNNGTIEDLHAQFERALVSHVMTIQKRMAEQQNAVSQ